MRNARRNKRLAELAAKEVKQLAAPQSRDTSMGASGKPSISPEGKARIRRLEQELEASQRTQNDASLAKMMKSKIEEELILREIEIENDQGSGKSFFSRFVEGYSGTIREELDLEMNARLSSSISDFFGSQDSEVDDTQ